MGPYGARHTATQEFNNVNDTFVKLPTRFSCVAQKSRYSNPSFLPLRPQLGFTRQRLSAGPYGAHRKKELDTI